MKKSLYFGILITLIVIGNLSGCKKIASTSAQNLTVEKKSPPVTEKIENPISQEPAASPIKSQPVVDLQAEEDFWIGKYEHQENDGIELLQLEVKKKGQKLVGVYRSEATSMVMEKFSLTVEIKGNIASFYYDGCLPLTREEKENQSDFNPCEGKDYRRGDLMFKLIKAKSKNQKIIAKIIEGKLEGFHGDGEDNYFPKVKKFMWQ